MGAGSARSRSSGRAGFQSGGSVLPRSFAGCHGNPLGAGQVVQVPATTDSHSVACPGLLGASQVSTGPQAEDAPECSQASEAPGKSPKHATRQSSISYNRAEEELMASIEREYSC
ncbi:cystin-1 isoform X4 [Octodon degus]|uniref:Cystin-1 isoform X4 n=1 Tax=Octodon degus TaxID=10160 RepID=A0A6P6DEX2_OCTDE|nr:cystin-1 isoform X4 [Octodon degus]